MTRIYQAIRVQDATEAAPTLSLLLERARESEAMLAAISPLIPAALRNQIKAGPWEQGNWCLLVRSNATAAKLRQLTPTLQAGLSQRGWQVNAIRLKIQAAGP